MLQYAESQEALKFHSGLFQGSNCSETQTSQVSSSTNAALSGYKPADWIWVELSMVAEVERVFVWQEDDLYRVVSVVNKNDEAMRDKIYERELALIESLPTFRFDFYVLPRMGNELAELVDYSTKPAYSRR